MMQDRGVLAEVDAASSAHLSHPLMEIGVCVRCEDFADAAEDLSPSDYFVAASVEHKRYRLMGGEVLGLRRGGDAAPPPLRRTGCVDGVAFSVNLNLEAVVRASNCPKGQSRDALR